MFEPIRINRHTVSSSHLISSKKADALGAFTLFIKDTLNRYKAETIFISRKFKKTPQNPQPEESYALTIAELYVQFIRSCVTHKTNITLHLDPHNPHITLAKDAAKSPITEQNLSQLIRYIIQALTDLEKKLAAVQIIEKSAFNNAVGG